MTIEAARKFISQAVKDAELRAGLNKATNGEERQSVLEEAGLEFTFPEFDEAWHNLLAGCGSEEDAMHLKDFRQWWEMLEQMFP